MKIIRKYDERDENPIQSLNDMLHIEKVKKSTNRYLFTKPHKIDTVCTRESVNDQRG